MSEFQVIPNPSLNNTNVKELYSNDSLQFAYYEINPDRMMGFTAETEDEFCTTLSTTFIFVHLLITLYHMTVFYSILF